MYTFYLCCKTFYTLPQELLKHLFTIFLVNKVLQVQNKTDTEQITENGIHFTYFKLIFFILHVTINLHLVIILFVNHAYF